MSNSGEEYKVPLSLCRKVATTTKRRHHLAMTAGPPRFVNPCQRRTTSTTQSGPNTASTLHKLRPATWTRCAAQRHRTQFAMTRRNAMLRGQAPPCPRIWCMPFPGMGSWNCARCRGSNWVPTCTHANSGVPNARPNSTQSLQPGTPASARAARLNHCPCACHVPLRNTCAARSSRAAARSLPCLRRGHLLLLLPY